MRLTLFFTTSLIIFSLSSCVPLLVGGGSVATVTNAAKQKGLGGAISDSQISSVFKVKLYSKDQDLHRRVGVNVQNGEILLTGSLDSQELLDEVEQIAWSVDGVRKVINEMGVQKEEGLGLGEGMSDGWITTQIKSSIMFTDNVKSINYSIKTVSGIVYIMGNADNEAELKTVMEVARKTHGVKKVMNYVKVRENGGDKEESDSSSSKEPNFDAPADEVASEEPEAITVEKEAVEGD